MGLRARATRLRSITTTSVAVAVSVAVIVAACSGKDATTPTDQPDPVASLPTCGTRTEVFTVSPIALNDFRGWVPLGNLNPPLHTFPSPHQYLYHTQPGGALHTVAVVSPGEIVVTQVARRTYTDGRNDFTLDFASCREVTGYFNHLAALDASISSRLGSFDQRCFTGTGPPAYTDCASKLVSIPVSTGAPVGMTGGVAGLYAWDFGLRDARVAAIPYANPARWSRGGVSGDFLHVVAASDYYAEPTRSQIAARLGSGDGVLHRTVPPIGGTLALDVPGTAQGAWFNTAQLGGDESPHFAIEPDNIDPTRFAVSGSTSLTGYSPTVGYWTPVASGLVNPAPRTIVPDAQIRCLNFSNGRSMLLLLPDATTLRVEVRAATVTCAAQQPWTFTTAAFDYHR